MFAFGSIVLTRFPFTDLSSAKVRPARVISDHNDRRSDIVLAFMTSNTSAAIADALLLQPSSHNGLKVPTLVRFDKIATLEMQIVAGKIGDAEPAFLKAAAPIFFGVFGFGEP
ncbi:MAG: type II toxin-antitoxin system PemK/MazF family toxin [Alphaproteobacteria bacterium]|nr:type II toxin-antitoxin system PemK/MazF family toxin [Alphaproteobacteria bacterium]MBV9061776.1 type II toxin-antitoxin system PemK/MazF family toxin [Alphaproteobacteria bacterium]